MHKMSDIKVNSRSTEGCEPESCVTQIYPQLSFTSLRPAAVSHAQALQTTQLSIKHDREMALDHPNTERNVTVEEIHR